MINKTKRLIFSHNFAAFLYSCIIGVSLNEPHTSKKDVCDRPSMEIYDQMRKTVLLSNNNANLPLNAKKTNFTSSLVSYKDAIIHKEHLPSSVPWIS